MHPQLQELMDSQLLTPDEAQELEGYVTADPATFRAAPQWMQDKAMQGLMLLQFDPEAESLLPN